MIAVRRIVGRKELWPGLMLFCFLLAVMVFSVVAVSPATAADQQLNGETADEFSDEYADADIMIADPLESYNRMIFTFNDRLYFWLLKPVSQGYGKVVPEPLRIGVDNFFYNLSAPIRLLNCLLQGKFTAFGGELSRFLLNSTVGVAGLMDPASYDGMKQYDEDFSQTLGFYGMGHGFYLVWPFFGPSSARGTVGLAADYFTEPRTWIFWDDLETAIAVASGNTVNSTSLSIGTYEDLIKAVLDPYVAVRNAYYQHQLKKVEE
ncbi:MAG: VacJ family lipoprotein [Xanthomonadaceae bacterium]|nr:VacJ family lipoprotein [Xanthomonadaceae bacterium]